MSGSMTSDFFKSLLQVIRQRDEFAFAARFLDPRIIGFDERVQFRWRNAIFPPGVVGRFHFDRAQRDNGGTGEDADFFAPHRRAQPFAEILFRVGDRESRHMDH